MSQAEFGTLGGVARNAQYNYEKGTRLPDARYLAAIAEAGADIQYIIVGRRKRDTPPLPSIDEEITLIENYRTCSAQNRGHLQAIGEALAQVSQLARKE